ncbi:glutamate synthase large subunit [Staphylococcus simiae]|uniref:glutamate synthase large subunit n=1 Tax=Staphylococcus simiae TaxID=308354 RepID=UPI001A968B75|nr:glutamate synthase large subunit [Staphylococcus simiae]MBO1199732.1 glutamate synthase large subunit [Staphylococcus simiae]MBO1202040.1 glutamate synthase large subunit [Staphylococcus simiae]MBO1204285.1 glutamate synthase large subunit [Staphylococcus simiae]MBO1230462.1 glutamate synthase large subunit [Staphylococcus simiae]QSY54218.1 glutamate synthase large subunit [Staphylococcus simiae]
MHNDKLIKGLYDYREEHDACGIGFYANMDNKRSHDIIDKSLEMLRRLDHRGGVGADGMTGDGAGIMTEIPFEFFEQHITEFKIPGEGNYAVGLFFAKERIKGSTHESMFHQYFENEGLKILGFRDVPVNKTAIAEHVAQTMPVIQQVFIDISNITDVTKKLFLARKQLEYYTTTNDLELYFTSLSHKTIVYKGWLRSDQIKKLYLDLSNELYQSKLGLVHSRFSTNTFPSWKRAHPNRLLMHNGEINTIKGNVNWMRARQHKLINTVFGKDQHKIFNIVDEDGSDSAIVDNALEFLSLSMEPEKAAMLLIPEPWLYNKSNDANVRAFYEFYSYLMEPWDGPTMISFCNGDKIGALTDRNGLRPGRYTITKDNFIVFSSEVGVVDVPESNVAFKGQLNPGKLLLVDFNEHKVIENNDLKTRIANELPYQAWIEKYKKRFDFESIQYRASDWSNETLFKLQRQFAYTKEDINKYMQELVESKKDPIGAMGYDAPIAVLNDKPESLFNYFKQLFAQVTNPPIDAYREKIVTSELSYLGGEGNLINPDEHVLDRIQLKRPVLNEQHIESIDHQTFNTTYLSTLYDGSLEEALNQLGESAIRAVTKGAQILVLDDSGLVDDKAYAMPMLLAISHIHQLLIKENLRMDTSLVAKSGETREVHHVACLLGYGANAVVPYLAQRTIEHMTLTEQLPGDVSANVKTYTDVLSEGVIKVMAKMGISTVQSYQGAQIFEAIGLSDEVINRYFTGTQSKLSGLSIEQIDTENKARQQSGKDFLESGSTFQWRQQGQHHAFNPQTIFLLQHACRDNDYAKFKDYSQAVNHSRKDHIRHLLEFKPCHPIDIDQVEPISDIVKRFNTGAMSYGSISAEAHETLAQAMNELGGKSNSGEGGEDPKRYEVQVDGSNKVSAIKQVASGRFGVTSDYLQHAKEIQIKVAQGAKPGEGGQLPGTKVYPWIAKTRGSTPGIGLISPPPHHDIYSIEDLAQLIHDLKNANKDADIAVKLVSKTGVGTIASGVAKAFADKIVISGYDGGTGASPKTSIQHAGVPWEIGLAETHQTLKLNDLRSRVKLETDGKLLTGKDVAYACALGAEEFGFATAPLVVLGCIMMRVCHKDTCPVGVATQNKDLRALFRGKAQHVVNFMHFIAQELREILASLGLRSVEELVGRTDLLQKSTTIDSHSKAASLRVERLIENFEGTNTKVIKQDHHLDIGFDLTQLYETTKPYIAAGQRYTGTFTVNNEQRDVGVITGSEITKRYGEQGLPENTINIYTNGHAGQSLAAYAPKGLTVHHTGDANDYVGKGLSGGTVIVKAPFEERQNEIIAGNVSFYGASGGKAFINGKAGERFCIRNSGADVVVEGIGDHGLEYMTGGHVLILGDVGKNFGQGMSGGVAYIIPSDIETFIRENQLDTLLMTTIKYNEEKLLIKGMLEEHIAQTNSTKAIDILKKFNHIERYVVKVIPKDYQLMMQKIALHKSLNSNEDEATLAAFYDDSKVINHTQRPAIVY